MSPSSDRSVPIESGTALAMTAAVFALDLFTPLAWADWLLYSIPLVLAWQSPHIQPPYRLATIITALMALGAYLHSDIDPLIALFNRGLGIAVMWGFTWLMVKQRRVADRLTEVELAMSRAETHREAAVEARQLAETSLTGALHRESQAARELLVSSLRLEGIIRSAMDAILTVDDRERVLLFNEAAERMFQCPAREAIGQTIERFIPARFRTSHHEHLREFGQSGATSRKMGKLGTVVGLRANSEEFPIEAAISQITVEDKNYYTVILRDITERVRAEGALRESQRQLATLISNLPGYVYRCRNDREWTVEYISDGVADMTGYSADDYLVRRTISLGAILHPDDRERIWEEVQTAISQRRPYEITYRILTKSGETRWAWEKGEGIYGQDGALLHLEGFVTDITERKRAEQLIRHSEERYRRLIAVSPYAILVNRADRVIFANDQAIKLFGAVKADEILGRSPFDLFHPDYHPAIHQRIHELTEGGQIVPMFEEQIVRLDGTPIDVDVSAALFTDEEGPAILVMLRDISERKRLQEQLRKTERVAELGTLASGMAHEIGTPMNVILGRAEYLMDRVREEPIKRGLATIITQVERITKVMNQLLAFARRKPPERVPVALDEVVENSVEMFHERLAKAGVQVEIDRNDRCPKALADADQMSQVFINLIMNALHAMPDGGRLRIALTPAEDKVKVTVSDTGHGIPPEALRRIFEPFFTTKDFGKGTGLGLTVVKGIIEEHHGSIEVHSDPDKGTTFTILLPKSE